MKVIFYKHIIILLVTYITENYEKKTKKMENLVEKELRNK